MKRLLVQSFSVLFLAAAGCTPGTDGPPALDRAGAPATERGGDAVRMRDDVPPPPPTPTLAFDADWRVQQSGPVFSGGKALVHYDIARLPNCRATYMGYPAWDVLAYWSTDGGPAHSQPLTTLNGTTRTPVDITIDVPPGHDFAMWFYASDEYGCTQWDSDYGRDFHFALQPGPPTIHFPFPGWDDHVDGTLAAGGAIMIDYDVRRLWECRQDYNGLQTWDVTVFYRFDDGATSSASLTRATDGGRVAAPATFGAPAGARRLSLWFENTDRTGCSAWDSRYGNNYVYALQ